MKSAEKLKVQDLIADAKTNLVIGENKKAFDKLTRAAKIIGPKYYQAVQYFKADRLGDIFRALKENDPCMTSIFDGDEQGDGPMWSEGVTTIELVEHDLVKLTWTIDITECGIPMSRVEFGPYVICHDDSHAEPFAAYNPDGTPNTSEEPHTWGLI